MQVKELVKMEAVVAKVKELTAKERDEKTPEASEVAKKVTKILFSHKKDFGCALNPVRELVSAIIGEEIKSIREGYYPFGVAFVITKNWRSDCGYEKDEIILIDGDASFAGLKTSGFLGRSSLPSTSRKDKYLRPATNGEVDKFFDLFDYERGKTDFLLFCVRLADR